MDSKDTWAVAEVIDELTATYNSLWNVTNSLTILKDRDRFGDSLANLSYKTDEAMVIMRANIDALIGDFDRES